jgi:pantoate--beta-alanine ligase
MASPIVVTSPEEARAACEAARARGSRVGLVPTMGALHEGHLELVREALRHGEFVMVSIFVNPTQFGPNEDFARYPRDLEGDIKKLYGASVVFAPQPDAMYPPGDETRVHVGPIAASLCGPHRPGHFEGVATVVTKLFGIAGPCTAVFGRKDYQQLQVLKRVARDLFLPINVVGVPIVREKDGLAMSSRNMYLSAPERERALALSRGLAAAAKAFASGERSAGKLRALTNEPVAAAATSIDYVTIADPDRLVPFDDGANVGERAVIAIACRIGNTRLIDNVVLGEDPIPSPRP